MSARRRKFGPVPQPARPPREALDICGVIARSNTQRRFPECGCVSYTKFDLDLYGEIHEPSEETVLRWDVCGDCFLDRVLNDLTRCVRCGYAIHPGDHVTLYPRLSGDPAWTTKVRNGAFVIGCSREACVVMIGLYAGRWSENGFIPALKAGQTFFEASWGSKVPKILTIAP